MLFLRNCSVPPNSPPHNYEMLTASQQPGTEYSFIHRHITLSLNFMTILLPSKTFVLWWLSPPSLIIIIIITIIIELEMLKNDINSNNLYLISNFMIKYLALIDNGAAWVWSFCSKNYKRWTSKKLGRTALSLQHAAFPCLSPGIWNQAESGESKPCMLSRGPECLRVSILHTLERNVHLRSVQLSCLPSVYTMSVVDPPTHFLSRLIPQWFLREPLD